MVKFSAAGWRDVVLVHRLQFPLPVLYLCYAAWGVCYGVRSPHGLVSVQALAVTAANLLFLLAGLALNTAADIASDEKHDDKRDLAFAAVRFGRRRVMRWAAAEFAGGAACVLVVLLSGGSWPPLCWAAGTVVLHLLYNLDPVRLKHRGFAGAAAFALALPGFPALLAYSSVSAELDGRVVLVFAGLTVLTSGRTAWWSVPDLAADLSAGARTAAVRYGRRRATAVACAVMAAGLGLAGAGLWLRYGVLAAAVALVAHVVVLVFAVAPVLDSRFGTPSSRSMRKRTIPLVAVGELLVTVVPLALR